MNLSKTKRQRRRSKPAQAEAAPVEFTREVAADCVSVLGHLPSGVRRQIESEIYEAAHRYMAAAREPQLRPSQQRDLLFRILDLSSHHLTRLRRAQLVGLMRSLPPLLQLYYGVIPAERSRDDALNRIITRLSASTETSDDSLAELRSMTESALEEVPPDRGGPRARDEGALQLVTRVLTALEVHLGPFSFEGFTSEGDQPPAWTLVKTIASKVTPWISPSKAEDYIREALSYGEPEARAELDPDPY
jgi:hypothetical protein